MTKDRFDIKIKVYKVISRAIEEAIPMGIARYLKYSEDRITSPDALASDVHRNIMAALDDVVDFGE